MAADESERGEIWDIGKVLRWTTAHFASHGIDSPRLTAELLLAHTLGISRLTLYLHFDQPLNLEERDLYRQAIRRRIQREPVAYITKERSFWTLDLETGPEALIPRPDTETLVSEALKHIPLDLPCRILDLGTGTGCIALALATERPLSQVFSVDVSLAACQLALKNILKSGFSDRVFVMAGNWCTALRPGIFFDLVVSNPPYIPTADIKGLAPEVRDYEPSLALDGGPDGFVAYRTLALEVKDVLRPGGWLLLEIGYDQRAGVSEIFKKTGFYTVFSCQKDLGGQDRVLAMQRI